jgi:hypothetical protein
MELPSGTFCFAFLFSRFTLIHGPAFPGLGGNM